MTQSEATSHSSAPHATEHGSTEALTPVAPSERILTLDVLRGFALLGICVINVPGFFVPYGLEAAGARLDTAPLDRAAEWLVEFFGSGKFNSIFSFLFGVGFALQLDRAASRHANLASVYLRRLAVLFLFGVLHLVFLWDGDVLHIYALLGVPLLFLRRVPDRWLWALAMALLLAPIAHTAFQFATQHPSPRTPVQWQARGQEQLRIYGKGSYDALLTSLAPQLPTSPALPVVGQGRYLPILPERITEIRDGYLRQDFLWFFPVLGTTILAGFIIGRRRVFQRLDEFLPAIRRLTLWTGIVGFGLAAAYASLSVLAERGSQTPTLLGSLGMIFYTLGRPVLCVFYMGVIVLLCGRPGWDRPKAWLASAGRMPLTNYLMQSVVHSLIFYGYGLGLFGRVGIAVGSFIALGTFAAEVVWSRLWMQHFAFGPAEWLWRTLSYGRAPRMRLAVTATAGV